MELDTAGTGYTYKWSFQFLIGFMQSKCLIRMFSLKQTNHTVSIPYRVHAIDTHNTANNASALAFQFLIGFMQ